jgi:hypothetical protein
MAGGTKTIYKKPKGTKGKKRTKRKHKNKRKSKKYITLY